MMQNPKSDTNLFTRQNRLTDFENELMVTGAGEGAVGGQIDLTCISYI